MTRPVFAALGLALLLAACGQNTAQTPATAPVAQSPSTDADAVASARPALADKLLPVDPARAIPGQYIVVLNKGTLGSNINTLSLQSQAERVISVLGLNPQGVTMKQVYGTALTGFAAQLSAQNLAQLRADSRVKYIEQDQVVKLSAVQSGPTWGLDRVDQRNLPLDSSYTYLNTASNVTAYIVDTGINTSNTDFGGRATVGNDQIGDGQNGIDCNGHGTHVAGTVGGSKYGVAKSVRLVAVRVLDCSGSGSNSGVIAGVNWVATNAVKPAVANMSLGGGASQALDDAVTAAVNKGVTFAVAGGNDNANACNSSPARAAAAITVGATTNTDARASFSNYGSCLDIFAPGQNITSDWIGSTTATNTISGTSMATPHVAGAAALVLGANPSYTPAQVATTLTGNATTGKVTSAGTGSPNRLLYTQALSLPSGGGTGTSTTYSGSLSGSGYAAYKPGSAGFSYAGGTLKGVLSGPSGADFDLYLQKLSGSSWNDVAASESSTSSESISYAAGSGTYRWQVYSYSGSGSYSLTETR
ncbi:S8 family peptidase [Deinococcus sonorensis KR-87]